MAQAIIGVKVYEPWTDEHMERWESAGVNTIFSGVFLPDHPKLYERTRNRGFQLSQALPIYYQPLIFDLHPQERAILQSGAAAHEDWVKFLCPHSPILWQTLDAKISQISRLKGLWGLSVDFFRHFGYWEMEIDGLKPRRALERSCFCSRCREIFSRESGFDQTPARQKIVDDPDLLSQWDRWVNKTMAGARDCLVDWIRSRIHLEKLLLHTIPWTKEDYDGAVTWALAQDLEGLCQGFDMITPMVYHHMLYRDSRWIHKVVVDQKERTGLDVVPSIQGGICYRPGPFPQSEFSHSLDQALREPSAGVVLFNDQLSVSDQGHWPSFAEKLKTYS